MRKLFLFFILLSWSRVYSQSVTPSVIHTSVGGGTVGTTGTELYYNIGEPIVTTIINSNNIITQGFLQPEIVGTIDLSITPLFQNESCLNKHDGFISLVLNSSPSSAIQLVYVWNPSSICPSQNCSSIDSLSPGNYSVTVLAVNSNSIVIDSVSFSYNVLASTSPCQISVYNGFTPDGDGLNDNWVIENIENFPNNSVSIFNRWGNKVWRASNYNNSSVVWNGKQQNGTQLVSGTYFYIIEIEGGNGVKKGWVELTN